MRIRRDNRFEGDASDNIITGTGGDDRIRGRSGDDTLAGQGGDDRLRGDRGDDALHGGLGDDRLRGDAGDDALSGGEGNDRLRGGRGDDILTGDEGRDRFVFGAFGDDDRVTDFTDGEDRIDLSNFGFATVEEALSGAAQVGADVVLALLGTTVTLQGVDLADLGASDLIL